MLAICALDKLVVFKAPKTSSRTKSVSQGAKPEAETGHKKPTTSSKQPSMSSKEATKRGSSKVPTGVTSKERANPQLSSDFIIEVDPRLFAPNDSIPPQQGMDEGTKNTSYDHIFAEEASSTINLEDLAKLVSQMKPSFKDLDSPKDDCNAPLRKEDVMS
nr:hypothetical protein [Tanacetum cinerariifolium]